MTTAHRPTFDPARGKEALRGPAYHQRLLPAYTQLKFRQPGQGGEADHTTRDLRAELEAAEAAHYAKLKGAPVPGASSNDNTAATTTKRPLPVTSGGDGADPGENEEQEDPEAKRRRILAETRDIDADDESGDSDSSEEDDDDDSSDDDEDAELQRELERVRRERLEKREAEERARRAAEEEAREREIALGNPLLNSSHKAADFAIKRRWDDDVVFKNQARGTEEKGKRTEFINDLLRSDFHKRFMNKYVR
ncbi:Pre-mRNA-splicing factor Cwf15/Cwc15 [Corynascus novoguineensis]|uniref:Pre-mRNA-splicing factor Cwf15/Cwc15 n=1 Tax=Corynascus novoguineensis TaxID=1126955 RepID=A0AAN7D629_9PEZI|nr:Pre-mRNA-splicing factor Cwf15/Cwc15 [Corynascus novoguineensis]